MKTKSKTKPVHEIRVARLRAAIWENVTEAGTRYSVTVTRPYKDQKNGWNDSYSFGLDDLPAYVLIGCLAFAWIYQNRTQQMDEAEEA